MSDSLKQKKPNMHRVEEALAGKISTDELTAVEQDIHHERYMDSLWQTTPEQKAFYAEQVKSGKGVGIDELGNTVYQ